MDVDTFCAAIQQHQITMFRVARSILKSDEDAEDAVQDALYAAFRSRNQLRDPQKFKSWILQILVRKCQDHLRAVRSTVDLSDCAEQLSAPDHDLTETITLRQAVAGLPDDQRTAVVLFYYEDLTVREISQILRVSESAVKTRLFRGRQQLKQVLEER